MSVKKNVSYLILLNSELSLSKCEPKLDCLTSYIKMTHSKISEKLFISFFFSRDIL